MRYNKTETQIIIDENRDYLIGYLFIFFGTVFIFNQILEIPGIIIVILGLLLLGIPRTVCVFDKKNGRFYKHMDILFFRETEKIKLSDIEEIRIKVFIPDEDNSGYRVTLILFNGKNIPLYRKASKEIDKPDQLAREISKFLNIHYES